MLAGWLVPTLLLALGASLVALSWSWAGSHGGAAARLYRRAAALPGGCCLMARCLAGRRRSCPRRILRACRLSLHAVRYRSCRLKPTFDTPTLDLLRPHLKWETVPLSNDTSALPGAYARRLALDPAGLLQTAGA